MGTYYPSVIEKTGQGEIHYDIFTRLLKERIVFISGEITDATADSVIAQLLYLESENSSADISIYINSPGGSVSAGLAIYDTIEIIKCDVQTICMGQAASMGAILFAAGTKGKRMMLPSARIMIHQPWGGVSGQATDIKIQAKEILRSKELIISYLAAKTNKSDKELRCDLERDYYMDAKEAIAYGIADKILKPSPHGN